MKLKLRIFKKETKDYTKTQYRIAIIDLDRSKQYPQNFVCMLPKNIKLKSKPSSIFEGIFGNQSLEMANQLLEKALKTRPDSETTKTIRERLKLLNPKPTKKSICQNCGKTIKQYKRGFRTYKLCYECHQKRYLKK